MNVKERKKKKTIVIFFSQRKSPLYNMGARELSRRAHSSEHATIKCVALGEHDTVPDMWLFKHSISTSGNVCESFYHSNNFSFRMLQVNSIFASKEWLLRLQKQKQKVNENYIVFVHLASVSHSIEMWREATFETHTYIYTICWKAHPNSAQINESAVNFAILASQPLIKLIFHVFTKDYCSKNKRAIIVYTLYSHFTILIGGQQRSRTSSSV